MAWSSDHFLSTSVSVNICSKINARDPLMVLRRKKLEKALLPGASDQLVDSGRVHLLDLSSSRPWLSNWLYWSRWYFRKRRKLRLYRRSCWLHWSRTSRREAYLSLANTLWRFVKNSLLQYHIVFFSLLPEWKKWRPFRSRRSSRHFDVDLHGLFGSPSWQMLRYFQNAKENNLPFARPRRRLWHFGHASGHYWARIRRQVCSWFQRIWLKMMNLKIWKDCRGDSSD